MSIQDKQLTFIYASLCLCLPIIVFTAFAQANDFIQLLVAFLTAITVGLAYPLLYIYFLCKLNGHTDIRTLKELLHNFPVNFMLKKVLKLVSVGAIIIAIGFAFRNPFYLLMILGSGFIYYSNDVFEKNYMAFRTTIALQIIRINNPEPKKDLVVKGTGDFIDFFNELHPRYGIETATYEAMLKIAKILPLKIKQQHDNITNYGILAGLSAFAGYAWQAHLRKASIEIKQDFLDDVEVVKNKAGDIFYFGNTSTGVLGSYRSISIWELLTVRIEQIFSDSNLPNVDELDDHIKQSIYTNDYGMPQFLQTGNDPNPLLILTSNWDEIFSIISQQTEKTFNNSSYDWHIIMIGAIDYFLQEHFFNLQIDGGHILQIVMESAISASYIDIEQFKKKYL